MELNAFRLRGETTAGDVWAGGAMSSEGEGTELEDEQLLPCGGGESLFVQLAPAEEAEQLGLCCLLLPNL